MNTIIAENELWVVVQTSTGVHLHHLTPGLHLSSMYDLTDQYTDEESAYARMVELDPDWTPEEDYQEELEDVA